MHFQLPPALLYGFGAVLMIFGGLRFYFLGVKRKQEMEAEAQAAAKGEETLDSDWQRAEGGGYKRHMTWGALWMAMGLFLIISTAIKS